MLLDVALHPHAERLDALQQVEGIGRRQAGAEIAQALGAGAHDERGRSELLVEDDAVIAGIGLGELRELSRCRASRNLPPSTITPPMATPWPPIHFVVECMTMSAPSSIGFDRNGVANVLSISSGIFASCAIAATCGMSSTSSPGLPMVSPITSRVFGLMLLRNAVEVARLDEGGGDAEARQRVRQKIDGAAVERGRTRRCDRRR